MTALEQAREALETAYEATRVMSDPEHCCHESRDNMPWAKLGTKIKAALARLTDEESKTPQTV